MTELVKTQAGGVVPFQSTGMPINASDIILPAVSIRQNSYRKDVMKAFKPGDLIRRPENTLLAHLDKPVAFVPISIEKCWRICDITKNEAKTIGYEPYVEGAPLTEMRDKMQVRRDRTYIAHVLFREDLANQAEMFKRLEKGETVDPGDFILPCRLVFTRSSFQAGKVLFTHFELSRAINQSPATITFELKTIESSNDQGHWFSLDVQKAKDQKIKYTPKDLLGCCDFWVGSMKNAAQFKSHEDAEEIGRAHV